MIHSRHVVECVTGIATIGGDSVFAEIDSYGGSQALLMRPTATSPGIESVSQPVQNLDRFNP